MEIPVHPRLHARLDRRRRGRADAPAGRAARVAARDARAPRLPAGRRERGRRDLALRHAAPARAGRARALAAGAADGRPLRRPRPRRASRKGAYVLLDAGRRSRRDPDRDRLRGDPRARGARRAGGGGHRRARRLDAVLGALRPAAAEYRDEVLPPDGEGARRDRAGLVARLGTATSATAARSSR